MGDFLMIQHTQTLFHAQNYLKSCIKLPSVYVYKVYMKHKGILGLDSSPTPKISRYVFANIPKTGKKSKI
jgi:hypothetical protein